MIVIVLAFESGYLSNSGKEGVSIDLGTRGVTCSGVDVVAEMEVMVIVKTRAEVLSLINQSINQSRGRGGENRGVY